MPIDYTKRTPAPSGQGGGMVSLTKAQPTVSLVKAGAPTSGHLRVNLNWTANPGGGDGGGGGLFRRRPHQDGIDLDLGCLYELTSGRKGVVQALGNSFGGLDQPPYIMLDGDDRSGESADGENLLINLGHVEEIRRILVFAYIYEGAPRFDVAAGVVTLFPAGGAPVEVRLDEAAGTAKMCGVALLENTGSGLSVRREVRYVTGGHSALDKEYGWGLGWKPGRK
ncbi:MAG: Tellurium resistance [Actinomycetota bacterium]|nr:Tellurium resistance [Actinomycetota bacterium]